MTYVRSIQGKSVVIARLGTEDWILSGSFTPPDRSATTVAFSYTSEPELANILSALRDQGVAFVSAEAGWPPAAVFEQLRTRGLLSGTYEELLFSGPGKWSIRQK